MGWACGCMGSVLIVGCHESVIHGYPRLGKLILNSELDAERSGDDEWVGMCRGACLSLWDGCVGVCIDCRIPQICHPRTPTSRKTHIKCRC